MSLESLNCSYYHEVKCSQKKRQLLYIYLNIWPAPIIMSWDFRKKEAVLLK